jgi:hypothetical protein
MLHHLYEPLDRQCQVKNKLTEEPLPIAHDSMRSTPGAHVCTEARTRWLEKIDVWCTCVHGGVFVEKFGFGAAETLTSRLRSQRTRKVPSRRRSCLFVSPVHAQRSVRGSGRKVERMDAMCSECRAEFSPCANPSWY